MESMFVSPLTPQQAIDLYQQQVAYVECLSADKAPTLTILADPDGTGEPIEFTFIKQDSLDRFKTTLLSEIHRSRQLLLEELAAGIVPANYAPAA